jgi:hypothetical protein
MFEINNIFKLRKKRKILSAPPCRAVINGAVFRHLRRPAFSAALPDIDAAHTGATMRRDGGDE